MLFTLIGVFSQLQDKEYARDVVGNSYSVAVSPTNRADQGRSMGITTPDVIKNYLEHQGRVSFQGRRCLNIK